MTESIIVRENLVSKLRELATTRRALSIMKARIEVIKSEHPVFSEAEATSKILAAIDADVRKTAIEFFAEVPDKHPVDGLNIKEIKGVEFDSKDAYTWALSKLVTTIAGAIAMGQNKDAIVAQLLNDATFLTLDTKAFEKSLLGGLSGLPGNVITKPQPNIDSNLDVYYG